MLILLLIALGLFSALFGYAIGRLDGQRIADKQLKEQNDLYRQYGGYRR